MSLPTEAAARKAIPIYSGFIKYFPDAIAAVAELSRKGNDQHNPGKPLHWDRSKSGDEMDALMRHLLDDAAGVPVDTDGVEHLTKTAWRAMAALQKHLERKKPAAAFEENLWRAHDGGKMPCPPNQTVEVVVRCGNKFTLKCAEDHIWPHGYVTGNGTDPSRPDPHDIMQWRPV